MHHACLSRNAHDAGLGNCNAMHFCVWHMPHTGPNLTPGLFSRAWNCSGHSVYNRVCIKILPASVCAMYERSVLVCKVHVVAALMLCMQTDTFADRSPHAAELADGPIQLLA